MVQKGKFTKHYFEGSSRIVSKLGEGTFSQNKPKITAGGIDYFARSKKEEEVRQRYIKGLNTPPGPPTQHGIYASPEWTGKEYPSIDWEAISQNQEPPEGWPRYPRFNEPGDVPGPPVQFGEAITNANARAGFNFIPNGVEEKNIYYYHPDHLGSSSYITDKNGEVIQHTEYMAFGEVLVDEHSTTNKMPYLFNGKELDYETGLYYYGARYYDPKVSIFLNVDPLVEKTGTPYAYTYNNPINLIDPTGMESEGWGLKDNKWEWKSDLTAENYKELGYSDYRNDGSIITNTAIAGKENENTGLTYLGYNGKAEYIDYKKVASNLISAIWNSEYRRNKTGDKIGFSIGVDATAFLGINASIDFDWILTGKDASFYPYVGVSTGVNLADGFNGSVDVTFNKAWFSGSSNNVSASDLPGTSYGGSIGGKYIVGANMGYSYSPTKIAGWHQLNIGIGAGLEFSPNMMVNKQLSVSQQWFNIHTKTGKINYYNGTK